ncbi:MAG: Trk family potassium uptake protein [Chloroflexi bacterium]|nr:Trk family potassium uptake protein [Chloroflexota bacterium]
MPRPHGKRPAQVHRQLSLNLEGSGLESDRHSVHPSLILVYVFVGLMTVGTFALWMPQATASGKEPPFIIALFTAVSAASGTGLTVVDTAGYWSPFGQQVILGLIQLGGLAALVGSSLFLLHIARRTTGEEKFLLRDSMHVSSGRGMAGLVAGIVLYALVIEAAGAWFLFQHLSADQPQAAALWLAAFHSISAFNNAGFETMGMANYAADPTVNLVLAGLIVLGGISFIAIVEVARVRSFSRLSLDTKLVLTASAWLLGLGTLAMLWGEFTNPQSLGPMPFLQKLQGAFFYSANARTAGLSTLDIGRLAAPTLLFTVFLMFIGGSSGSTAGGVKINTFGLLAAATRSAIRGDREVELLGSRAHREQVNRAIAITFLSVLLVSAITFVLTITDAFPLLNLVFEVVSAFSTTGFSTGITPELSVPGKLLIVGTMFAGRVGPLTLAFALAHRAPLTRYSYAQEAINLG